MKLVVGLGNPEARFDHTRHNVGFHMLDYLAARTETSFSSVSKFRADIAETTHNGEKVLLVKPTTYYNEVGESVRSLLDFYKLSTDDILVIHDDLALPLGTIRTRLGGSDGGNNGLKSLQAHLGPATARIRIGVWVEHHHGIDKVSVVLGRFSRDEQTILDAERATVQDIYESFLDGSFEATTHRHNLHAE